MKNSLIDITRTSARPFLLLAIAASVFRTSARPFLLLAIAASVFTAALAQSNSAQPRKRQISDKCKVERNKLRVEEELRVALRTIRQAIDRYNVVCQAGLVGPLDRRVDDQCYPSSLETLVTGITPPN